MARSEWAVVPCGTRSWAYRVGRVANIIAPATLEQVIRDEEAATWSAALDAAVAAARDEEAAARAARVLRAETIAPSTMRLFFDRVMLADAPLLDPASYVLTAALGSVARNVVHVSLPDDCGAVVELGLSGELTTGVENYTLVLAGEVAEPVGGGLPDVIELVHGSPQRKAVDGGGQGRPVARLLQKVDPSPLLVQRRGGLEAGELDHVDLDMVGQVQARLGVQQPEAVVDPR